MTDSSVAGDWRLPTETEWKAFICPQYTNPSLCNTAGTGQWQEGNPFNNVELGFHWSSTELDADNVWGLFISDGEETFGHKSGSDGFAWSVRNP